MGIVTRTEVEIKNTLKEVDMELGEVSNELWGMREDLDHIADLVNNAYTKQSLMDVIIDKVDSAILAIREFNRSK